MCLLNDGFQTSLYKPLCSALQGRIMIDKVMVLLFCIYSVLFLCPKCDVWLNFTCSSDAFFFLWFLFQVRDVIVPGIELLVLFG